MQGVSALDPGKIGYGEMKNSLINRTCIMKSKDFLRSVILIVALSAFGISSGVASTKMKQNTPVRSRKLEPSGSR
jgi:hypothetical protein